MGADRGEQEHGSRPAPTPGRSGSSGPAGISTGDPGVSPVASPPTDPGQVDPYDPSVGPTGEPCDMGSQCSTPSTERLSRAGKPLPGPQRVWYHVSPADPLEAPCQPLLLQADLPCPLRAAAQCRSSVQAGVQERTSHPQPHRRLREGLAVDGNNPLYGGSRPSRGGALRHRNLPRPAPLNGSTLLSPPGLFSPPSWGPVLHSCSATPTRAIRSPHTRRPVSSKRRSTRPSAGS